MAPYPGPPRKRGRGFSFWACLPGAVLVLRLHRAIVFRPVGAFGSVQLGGGPWDDRFEISSRTNKANAQYRSAMGASLPRHSVC